MRVYGDRRLMPSRFAASARLSPVRSGVHRRRPARLSRYMAICVEEKTCLSTMKVRI